MQKENYADLNFSQKDLVQAFESCYIDIIEFVTQDVFQELFSKMMKLDTTERPQFVNEVWLNKQYLLEKGLKFSEGILIQTSAFGDRRPTLFVVKKFLPEKFHSVWENANLTFNNDFVNEEVPNDLDHSWRLPLNVSVQNAILSNGYNLQDKTFDKTELVEELYNGKIINSEKQ